MKRRRFRTFVRYYYPITAAYTALMLTIITILLIREH